jgi:hypothetical protein
MSNVTIGYEIEIILTLWVLGALMMNVMINVAKTSRQKFDEPGRYLRVILCAIWPIIVIFVAIGGALK